MRLRRVAKGKRKGGGKKPASPKQKAARARFAAMARARAAGSRAVGRVRGMTKRKGKAKGGGFHRAKGGIVKEARPLQMALFGLLGWMGKQGLAGSGLSWFLYNRVPAWKKAVDATYSAGQTDAASDGGAGMLMKLIGTAGAGYSVYKSRTGKVSTGVLNTVLPFSLGAIADPAQGASDVGNSYW